MQVKVFKDDVNNYLAVLARKDKEGFLSREAKFLLGQLSGPRALCAWLAKEQINTTIATAKKSDHRPIQAILDLAYMSRYANADEASKLTISSFDKGSTVKVLILKAKLGKAGAPVIVATLQLLVGSRRDIKAPQQSCLELFQLFQLRSKRGCWPHQKSQKIPVELGRFAFHPVFDVLARGASVEEKERLIAIKRVLTWKMWQAVLKDLRPSKNYEVMIITSDNVQRFLQGLDLKVAPVTNVVLAKNELVASLLKNFARYWSQAHLYTIKI